MLPMIIKGKIRDEVSAANSIPVIFKSMIPPGPAARVAMKHPEWVASQIIVSALEQFHHRQLPKIENEKDPKGNEEIMDETNLQIQNFEDDRSSQLNSFSREAPSSPDPTTISRKKATLLLESDDPIEINERQVFDVVALKVAPIQR